MRRPGMVTKNPDGSVGIRRLAVSFWLLDNGRCTLYVRGRELNHSAHAEAEPFRKLRQRFGPIDLGVMGENERGSPQVRLSNDWKGKRGVQWRSVARRFGGEDADVQATFVNANGKPDNRYWFNSKKGYVLIRMESSFGQDTPEQVLAAKKVVQDSKGGWFIEEAVSYAYVAMESNFIVREYKVLSVEPDPNESCFAITLEAGTRIMHDDLNFPNLRLPERRTITFQNLPALVREAEDAKQKRNKAAQERVERAMADLPHTQSAQSHSWIWGTMLIACAGVFFGLSFRRRSGALEA